MSSDLIDRMNRLAAQHNQSRIRVTSSVAEVSAYKLPVKEGALPNAILRSALFAVARRPTFMERYNVPTLSGIELTYTGHRLGQVELDVYLALLSSYGRLSLGSVCHTNLYRLLALLGRGDSGEARNQLRLQLSRLNASAVDIRLEGSVRYEGSLVDEIYHDEEKKGLLVTLNPRLHALFGPAQWTAVKLDTRRSLGDSALAKWLHAFYSTHKNPYSYRVETLHGLCGSGNSNMSSFTQDLTKALETVAKASRRAGDEFVGEIKSGRVHVKKGRKRSYLRHGKNSEDECRV